MLTAFIIFIILFFIYVFFYEQSASEYRINQVSYDLYNNSLLLEEEPIVLTHIPKCPIWTEEDISQRGLTVRGKKVSIQGSPPSLEDSRYLGSIIGTEVWMDKLLNKNYVASAFMKEIRATWGRRGLQPIHTWTAIIATEGETMVSLMHRKYDKFLPYKWKGIHPSQLTRSHTPFLDDIKYIDIVLRPGNALLVPPHWRTAFDVKEGNGLTLEVSFHHPMSLLMGAMRGY